MLRAANSNTDFRQQKRGGRVVLTSSKLLIGIAGRLTGLMRETTYPYSPRQSANPANRNKQRGDVRVHRLAYANHLQIGIVQSLIVICWLNRIDVSHVCFFDWLSVRHTSFRLQDVQSPSQR